MASALYPNTSGLTIDPYPPQARAEIVKLTRQLEFYKEDYLNNRRSSRKHKRSLDTAVVNLAGIERSAIKTVSDIRRALRDLKDYTE